MRTHLLSSLFFFNDTATTEIYTLSLHDALPISQLGHTFSPRTNRSLMSMCPHSSHFSQASAGISSLTRSDVRGLRSFLNQAIRDRKSTRLNSSHGYISYAVFCLKKKKKNKNNHISIIQDCI